MTTANTVSNHRRIAAWLHIGAGAFTAAVVALLWVCIALLAPVFDGTFIPELVSAVGRPVALVLLAFAALEVAAATALLKHRRWAPYALCAVGVVQLMTFPIGTALALYTLYALSALRFADVPEVRPEMRTDLQPDARPGAGPGAV